jgi:hypothetical protein
MPLFDRHDDVQSMTANPEFLFRVGRLIGACEMVGHMLSTNSDPHVQELGRIVLDRLTWFPAETLEPPDLPTLDRTRLAN